MRDSPWQSKLDEMLDKFLESREGKVITDSRQSIEIAIIGQVVVVSYAKVGADGVPIRPIGHPDCVETEVQFLVETEGSCALHTHMDCIPEEKCKMRRLLMLTQAEPWEDNFDMPDTYGVNTYGGSVLAKDDHTEECLHRCCEECHVEHSLIDQVPNLHTQACYFDGCSTPEHNVPHGQ